MPTKADLGKLASQLYWGNPSIGATELYRGNWNRDAATALGFTSYGFALWSGEEQAGARASARTFGSSSTEHKAVYRYEDRYKAVCIAD